MKITKKKSMISLLLVLLSSIILTGVLVIVYIQRLTDYHSKNVSGESDRYQYHFAMIVSDQNEAFWSSVYKGALETGSQSGAYVEMMGNSLNVSHSEYDLMNIAIAANVDGILLEPDGSEEVAELIEEANKNGIPVVTMLRDISDSSRISHVGISYHNLGQQYGEEIISLLSNLSKTNPSHEIEYRCMLLIDETIPDSSRTIIISGIQDVISSRLDNDIHVLLETQITHNASPFEAEESIRNIFVSEELIPDIFVCLDETCSACVYQAMVDHNQVGKTELVAYYTSEAILSGIEKNIIFSTMAVDTEGIGRSGVEALVEKLETGFSSDYYSVDTSIINKDNVKDYVGADHEEE